MKQTLEEITRGNKIVIDNCALTNSGVFKLLDKGTEGFRIVEEKYLQTQIKLLEEISALNGRSIVINEVYQEAEEFFRQYDAVLKKLELFFLYNSKRQVKISAEEKRKLSLLSDIHYLTHKFIKAARGTCPLKDLNFEESEQFLSYFDLAYDLFPYVRQGPFTIIKKNEDRNMHTDETLVATAFFLSHNYDVAILTRDLGVQNLAKKLAEFIENEETCWQYNLPQVNRKNISCIYPDNRNEEKVTAHIYPRPFVSSTSLSVQSQTSSALELFL